MLGAVIPGFVNGMRYSIALQIRLCRILFIALVKFALGPATACVDVVFLCAHDGCFIQNVLSICTE